MTFTRRIITHLKVYVISSKSVIYIGFLISQPSVFVLGPEACLSTFFVVFGETRAIYGGKAYLR